MNDRTALLAIARPEPEPFRQVIPTPEDIEIWQQWHDEYVEAFWYVRSL